MTDNDTDRAEAPPKLLDLSQERIRVLHYTWIAFFMTFFVWFNLAPLATTMVRDTNWLDAEQMKILAIINIALTIPARVVVGALVDRYGPRVTYSALMVTMAIPTVAFGLGNTFVQLAIARLFLSCIGAGFVIGIKMVAGWFPPRYAGRAQGFYGGWGNFGAAAAAMLLPWFTITFLGDWLGLGDDAWRWAYVINGITLAAYGVAYWFLVRDVPAGRVAVRAKKAQPMMCTSYGDLVQYLFWSVPLVGALGALAWRASNVKVDGEPLYSQQVLWGIYAVLAIVYVAHLVKTLQVNLPYIRAGVPEGDRYHWGSVAALNSTYFANFGAELAVVSMLPAFYETTFSTLRNGEGDPVVTATIAGLVASSFAFVNLVSRPLGGLVSDWMGNRKLTMLLYMGGITLGMVLMGLISKEAGGVDKNGLAVLVPQFNTVGWLVVAMIFTVVASIFVQGGAGATFAIIPFVNKKMTGQIAGMVGAYGSIGGVIYLVIYSLVDARVFFWCLAGGAAISFALTFLLLREPEGSFEEQMGDHHHVAEPPPTATQPA